MTFPPTESAPNTRSASPASSVPRQSETLPASGSTVFTSRPSEAMNVSPCDVNVACMTILWPCGGTCSRIGGSATRVNS